MKDNEKIFNEVWTGIQERIKDPNDFKFCFDMVSALARELIKYQFNKGIKYRLGDRQLVLTVLECGKNDNAYNKGFNSLGKTVMEYLEKDPTKASELIVQLISLTYDVIFEREAQKII